MLLVPTTCVGNVSAKGVALTELPVPLNCTVCDLLGALSLTTIVPVRVPGPEGVKVMLIVHEAPAGTGLPQVFDWEKSPEMEMLETLRESVAVEPFLTVNDNELLVTPINCAGNVTFEGEKVTIGSTPVPESGTICGLPGALSITCTDADLFPGVDDGVNVTVISQLAPAATEPLQLFEAEKEFALRPVMLTRVTDRLEIPVLDRVTVCVWLEEFTS